MMTFDELEQWVDQWAERQRHAIRETVDRELRAMEQTGARCEQAV